MVFANLTSLLSSFELVGRMIYQTDYLDVFYSLTNLNEPNLFQGLDCSYRATNRSYGLVISYKTEFYFS